MIPLDHAVVARIESHGERFEILVDPDIAAKIRQGNSIEIEDAVAALYIFENASQAEKASDESLKKAFGTISFQEIATKIITKGEIHLTAEQRRAMIVEKRRQVIFFIARNAINPQTGHPHPPQRIEMAMEEAKVNIDPFRSLEELVKDTMKLLRPLIPIKFEEVKVAVHIPADYAPRAYGEIQSSASIEQQEWQKDGSWICVVTIPAGIQNEFYDLINKISRGEAETKLIK
ncbi:MAG TPA: ribosome assembly factor SBDS [Methanospirillum sp.]|uniref:ribosome assembly factor SBDS n=1 Tax=Methanospirillum sp. TaxID=45200 RepID=UPI002B718BE7|nr:ribosome assembly factor SBDS [Methanospirillum sp.]HWQ64351.1 ribosome assembly factor SBDS [Methanospirillum sp.]